MHAVVLIISTLCPVLAMVYLQASSAALGLIISTAIFTSLYTRKIRLRHLSVITIIISLVVLHCLIPRATYAVDIKVTLSVLLLALVLIAASSLSRPNIYGTMFSPRSINILVQLSIFIATFSLITDSYLSVAFYGQLKGIFPYGEPSHFALIFGPFIVFYVITRKDTVAFACLIGLLFLGYLIESLTFLVYVAIAGFVVLLRGGVVTGVIGIICLLITFGFLFYGTEYFAARLDISADTENLSALVYFLGIDYAYMGLQSYIGYGFQMLGVGVKSDISLAIVRLLGETGDQHGNTHDGGFLAAKIIGEFGVFGLLILAYYMLVVIQAFLFLLRNRYCNSQHLAFVSSSIIVSSTVEVFIRGMGYFSLSIMFFLVSLFYFKSYLDFSSVGKLHTSPNLRKSQPRSLSLKRIE